MVATEAPFRRGRPLCLPEQQLHTANEHPAHSPPLREATGVSRAAIDMAAAPQRGANPPFATEGGLGLLTRGFAALPVLRTLPAL